MTPNTNRIDGLMDESADKATTDSGRDAQGRFTAGNAGGPGNPFGRYTAALREAMLSEVTAEDMQAVMRKLIEMAASGHVQAMKLFLQYTVGKPTPAPNPDHVELDEWNYFKQTAAMSEDVPTVVKSLEPEVVLNLGREMRPIMSELQTERIKKALDTGDVGVLYGKGKRAAGSAERSPSANGENADGPGDPSYRMAGAPSANGENGHVSDGPRDPSYGMDGVLCGS